MGTVISKAANGFGALVGNAFAAPITAIFGGSCEGVCSGTWDVTCFIEHLCISNLVKLLMVFGLCYITLVFFYLLFKLGICQCVGRSLCKMFQTGCETYWFALKDTTCFLWHRLKNVKRVDRHRDHRFRDVEVGFSSSGESDLDVDRSLSVVRGRKLLMKRRKDRLQRSFHPFGHGSGDGQPNHGSHHHHRVRLKRRKVSANIKGRLQGLKNLRQLEMRKLTDLGREAAWSKRRTR